MVLCPDVVPIADHRFDCCDLLQRSVIHHGAECKTSSAIVYTPWYRDRNDMLRVHPPHFRRKELQPCLLSDSGQPYFVGAAWRRK